MESQNYPADAWSLLNPFLSDARREKMLKAASLRTNHLRLVVQDIHNAHNVSACLRSAEAFGVLNADVVCLSEKFSPSSVTRGVDHWLRIRKHLTIETCAQELKASGYQIACAYPHPDAVPLHELPKDRPIAMVFGNEHAGVSPQWDSWLDIRFTIPMYGMVESFNISVAAAISMFHHMDQLRRSPEHAARLTLKSDEQAELLNEWVCKQFRNWPELLRRARNKS